MAAAAPAASFPVVGNTVAVAPAAGRFPREVFAPLPVGFVFPYFEHFSFYDHHGSFREAWPSPACSVADRPTDVEPSEGNYHFVMDVHEFLSVYPYPIGIHISSVTCTFVTFAQNKRWAEFIRDGSMLGTAEEFLLMLYIGTRSAGETSPGALRHIVGLPAYTVSTFEHGDPSDTEAVRAKNFDIYLRNLPPVPPSHLVPVSLQRPRASHPDPAVQMKLRSSFPPAFARAHVRVWDSPDLLPHAHGVVGRPAAVVNDGYTAHRVRMLCSYWAFASQYAPRVSADHLASMDRAPLRVAVPMGYTGLGVAALTPRDGGCFAINLVDSVPLLQQIQAFKTFLPCDVEPQQMGRTRNPRADVIFAMPYVGQVVGSLSDIAEWYSVPPAHSAAWCCSGALSSDQILIVSIAFERANSFVQAGPWLSGSVGVYHGPKPVYSARSAERFRSAHDNDHADAEWKDFLVLERDRRQLFVAAFECADAGTGLLVPFLDNVITAWDVRAELTPPPQGLPHVHVDVLLLLPYPEPPVLPCIQVI